MLRLLSMCFCLAWPMMAKAGTAVSPEIRAVQADSTDVFEVLTTLRAAQSALESRDYSKARQGFESVLMHDPELVPARTGLRRTLIALGDMQAASRLVADRASADSVIIRIRSGQVEDAESLLTQALQNTPDPRLWTLLGQVQDTRKEFGAARQSYAMAGLAGARPGLAENNIGQSHWLAGEYELALNAFVKATALAATDMQFDNNRRRTLVRLGRTQEAISGLDAERAALFLAKAAEKAAAENETKLAKLLYRKSLDIAPRYNPRVAEKLSRLE